jgi:hypothetical protein
MDRDEFGRWILPEASGLPALVLIDVSARAAICGYRDREDVLGSFTAVELLAFKEVAWIDGWSERPVLRSWKIGSRVIYGMWGSHPAILGVIFRMLREKGLRHVSVTLPRSSSPFNFYIVGGKRC